MNGRKSNPRPRREADDFLAHLGLPTHTHTHTRTNTHTHTHAHTHTYTHTLIVYSMSRQKHISDSYMSPPRKPRSCERHAHRARSPSIRVLH